MTLQLGTIIQWVEVICIDVPASEPEEHPLWSRGLMVTPFVNMPPPVGPGDGAVGVCISGPGAGWPLTGDVYTDASGLDGQYRQTRRIGCGAIAMDSAGCTWVKAVKPFVGPVQDITAGEIEAGTMVLRHGLPPVCIISDSKEFVDGVNKGKEWCISGDAAYAETWVDFWEAVDDFVPYYEVRWVPSHTTEADVQAGLISARDRQGNRLADDAAREAAKIHPMFEACLMRIQKRCRAHEVGWALHWARPDRHGPVDAGQAG